MTNEKMLSAKADLLKDIINALQSKKGREITSLDISHIENSPTESFIICHGNSDRQVESLAHEVEKTVSEIHEEKPWHKEGFDNKEWILLDYVNVVVHIFQKSTRDFYAIEELWADATIEKYESEAE